MLPKESEPGISGISYWGRGEGVGIQYGIGINRQEFDQTSNLEIAILGIARERAFVAVALSESSEFEAMNDE